MKKKLFQGSEDAKEEDDSSTKAEASEADSPEQKQKDKEQKVQDTLETWVELNGVRYGCVISTILAIYQL